jgi:protein-tyrosine phosphatase
VPDPFRILVVCVGNICRSPLAEGLLRHQFQELLPDSDRLVEVSSAGVRAMTGRPMDAHAAAELGRLGGDPDGLVGAQLTAAMVERADLVLTATRQIRSRVLEEAPRALRRTFTIREFAALADSDAVRSGEVDSPQRLVELAAASRSSAALDDYDVADPIGQDEGFHRRVAEVLDDSCTRIARAVAATLG